MKFFIISLILLIGFPNLACSKNLNSRTDSISIDSSKSYTLYVVNHGWHTGVVMQRCDFLLEFGPDSLMLPQGNWLEFGWGDQDFYMSTPTGDDVQWFTTIKAAIWPTRSVVHVVGFSKPPPEYFSYSGLIGLEIPDSLMQAMSVFIAESFSRNENGHINPVGPGLYGKSRFFSGREKYYFPKTCNVWTAKALEKGGIDLNPYSCQKSGLLMDRLANYGFVIRR